MPYQKETINPVSGQRLREELKNKGYSHSQFADMVDLDPKVIGFYCQGRRRITEKRAEQFAQILGVRSEYLLGIDDFRIQDQEWLRNATGAESRKQSFFEHCLAFWGYEITGSRSIYSENEDGDPEVSGMIFTIRKPSGEEIDIGSESIGQIETEILEFVLFKIQSLR